jgi:hypothetical protein
MTQPLDKPTTTGWKRGLPLGRFNEKTIEEYDLHVTPAGFVWHRKKQADQRTKGSE